MDTSQSQHWRHSAQLPLNWAATIPTTRSQRHTSARHLDIDFPLHPAQPYQAHSMAFFGLRRVCHVAVHAGRMQLHRWLPGCLSLLILGGCAQIPPALPLVGMAWDVNHQRMLPMSEVLQQAGAADIVLLGETHDNSDHHAIEVAFLEALAKNQSPVLVMEQYDLEQQAALDAVAGPEQSEIARLEALQRMMGKGWEWPGYRALLAAAVHRDIPVVAANASRNLLRQVSNQGFTALGPGRSEALQLDTGWSAAQQTLLSSEIADGHCGSLPPEAVAAIALAQRARDAIMADRILAHPTTPVLAILGRGHVRRDLGVPVYLGQRAGNRRFISVGLVETAESAVASDYDNGRLGALYDFVLFTKPLIRKTDPCTAFAPTGGK